MHVTLPLSKDLVLIGGGHAHALVLRMWGMDPLPGARVTVINPGPTAPYSGMLPGFVAGHYSRDDLDIDLVSLARFAGARIITGRVDGIDRQTKQIHIPDHPPVGYDIASIDVGITSEMPALQGFEKHAIPAKPLGAFANRWDAYRAQTGPASVVVIGAGVAGVELAMAMAFALRKHKRAAKVHLIDRSTALSVLPDKPRDRLLAALAKQHVTLIENAEITQITAQGVTLADGRQIEAEFVTGAAGAKPQGWLAHTGLDLHNGFVTVDDRLQSSDPAIFATGDCAHLAYDPRPKAGVFAVRQAPILLTNFRAALAGTKWQKYQPQKDYLKLISLGRKSAMAEKSGIPFTGRMMWQWKNHIDQKFMRQFRILPQMAAPELPKLRVRDDTVFKPLCTGCGAKVGRGPLRQAIATLPILRDDVQVLPGDDAALLLTGDARQVFTTDHLRAVTEDPALMARIAAVHALGDIWAMGAAPQAALAQITLPRMARDLQERTLTEIMTVAGTVMAETGAQIVGGHTTMGDALTIGFSITGLCDADPITLAGAQPGDTLIVTKPIGTGVLMAAHMTGQARGADVADAWTCMAQSHQLAAEILHDAHAMTDITGFGLAGHAQAMAEASGVDMMVSLDSIPILSGALAVSEAGVTSTLFEDNRMLAPNLPETGKARLLFDPQTAGGLLAAVPAEEAKLLTQDLRNLGYDAAIIGQVVSGTGQVQLA